MPPMIELTSAVISEAYSGKDTLVKGWYLSFVSDKQIESDNIARKFNNP